MSAVSKIASFFKRYPLLTASTQSGLLMCTGDLISQKFVEKKKRSEIDLVRTVRFGLVGFIIVGPVLKTWYGFLEKRIALSTPALTAVAKMTTDQIVLAPIFLGNFIALMGFLNGQSLEQVKADIKKDYFDIMIRNYQLWPAAQIFNFWIVPFQHRVLFAQSVALVWNTYLSFKTNRQSSVLESQKSNTGIVPPTLKS